MNYPLLLCSHLHLFPYFLSFLNPFILSFSYCLLGPGHARLRVYTPILHKEHSKSINICFNVTFSLKLFSHSPARSPPLFPGQGLNPSTSHMIWKLPACIYLPYLAGSTCRKVIIRVHLLLYLKVEYIT